MEKMALENVENIVVEQSDKNCALPFYMSSNSEYGWWVGGEMDDEAGAYEKKGRKNVIKETFYRRNGVGECMAV